MGDDSAADLFEPEALAAAGLVFPPGDLPYPPMPAPRYRAVGSGGWRLDRPFIVAAPGYFNGPRPLDWVNAVLVRDGLAWMSLTPGEMESQMPHLAAARGKVAICGMGMGVMAFAVSALRAVDEVVVIERDPEVIAVMSEAVGLDDWPQRGKLRIVRADAREVREEGVDFLYADIWPYYRMDCMVPDMRAIHRNIPAPACGYWGQELDMVDHARQGGRAAEAFSDCDVEAFIAATGLPLVGLETPGYAGLCRRAAANPAIGSRRRPLEG